MLNDDQKKKLKQLYATYRGGPFSPDELIDQERADIIMFGTDDEKLKALTEYQEAVELPAIDKALAEFPSAVDLLTAERDKLATAITDSKRALVDAGIITKEEAEGTISIKPRG